MDSLPETIYCGTARTVPVTKTTGVQDEISRLAIETSVLELVLSQCAECPGVRYIAIGPSACGWHIIIHVVTDLPIKDALRHEAALQARMQTALSAPQAAQFVVFVYANTELCPYAKYAPEGMKSPSNGSESADTAHTEDRMATRKGVPKRDGSGKGCRANRGRGGCKTTRRTGRGKR